MSREQASSDVVSRLSNLLGDRLTTAENVRSEHAGDVSHHTPLSPDAVVYPQSNEDVAQIVTLCAEQKVPVIPFGTGTAVEGGVVAVRGGICIDMSRMNQIQRLSVSDMDVTVQAGVTRFQLNDHLSDTETGLYFPVDPGANAALGGMAATCASGSAAVRYRTMRENVLGLTVVLADGRIIRTGGRARKSSAGYDLTRLFVGSEGTLGIITEVTLRLTRLPKAVSAAVCPFPSIEPAVNAVIEVMSSGIPMARTELLDELQMAAVNSYSMLNYEVTPTLFFEFHGSNSAVVEQTEAVAEIVKKHDGGDFQWAIEKAERDKLWQARHDAYYASLALRENGAGYVTDVCVPVSELAGCILRTKELLKSTNIPAPLYGHVGDGNYHVVFAIDPNNPAELDEVKSYSQKIIEDALKVGGTCSGEHGIGLGKLDALEQQYGAAVDVMREIKRTLDPGGIMNPGKVVRM